MSFSVATNTRPVASSGSPYTWPSRVGEVHAELGGLNVTPEVSTPLPSGFPWYTVQEVDAPEPVAPTPVGLGNTTPAATISSKRASAASPLPAARPAPGVVTARFVFVPLTMAAR